MARRWRFWADGWVEAAGATTVTAALQADWDPAEALAAIAESDRSSWTESNGFSPIVGSTVTTGRVWPDSRCCG
jgi:hypothetical protein